MEKSSPVIPVERNYARPHSRPSFVRYLTLLFASSLVLYNAYSWILPQRLSSPHARPTASKKDFKYSDLKPSTSLDLQPCYDGYECARLDVPLDWSASKEDQHKKRAAVAIIRLPAKVPVTSPRYGGAILVNPGGPGGSGVHIALSEGKYLQKIVDTAYDPAFASTSGLSYDIIGFDPRGVNHTTPSPSCFPDDTSRQFWEVAREATGSLGENDTFPLVWSRNKALAESCSRKLGEDWDGIGRYMNTPQVAADMVAIIEALGEWREKQGRDAVGRMKCQRGEAREIVERTKWEKGEEKLLYLGFSYGTILGSTFSIMYPDKVGRVLLDGVCDTDDYYSGTWLSNLIDTDLIIGSFFKQCDEAGPLKCPLWSTTGIEGIRTRYHSILDNLRSNPLPVDAHGKYSADVITLSDAMNVVRQAVYQPYEWFPILARSFDLLSRSNGTALAAMKQDSRFSTCRSPTCSSNPYSEACYSNAHESFKEEMSAAILCTDGPADQLKWESADHFAKWHALREQSRALGDFWAEITMYCANWNVRPAWNFSYADISSSLLEEGPIKTNHPILFASTTRDPVTPLRNARKMRGKFEGAGLVTLEDDGHCSMLAPSLCQASAVSRYFQTGELPSEEVRCLPDRWPFDDEVVDLGAVGEGARELVEATEHLGRFARRGRMPLGFW